MMEERRLDLRDGGTDGKVDVVLEGLLVPGDHHDGGLEHHLGRRLGQHGQRVQDTGPRHGLIPVQVVLPLAHLMNKV